MGREFTVEVRAVNNRYLDCTVKLPRSLTFAEDSVKQRVKSAVARGKVDVLVSVGAASGDPVQVSLNRPVLEGYLQAMRAMVKDYGVRDDISAAAWPAAGGPSWWKNPKMTRTSSFPQLLQVEVGAWLPLTLCAWRRALPWRRICAAAGKPFWSWWPRWKRVRPRPWPTTGRGWRPKAGGPGAHRGG